MNIYKVIANCLSALRFLIPIVLFGPLGSVVQKIVVVMVLISTDFVDGWFARKGGAPARLGEILDHTSDKVASLSIGIFILLNDFVVFPVIFTALVSETLIFLLSALLVRLNGNLIITKIGRTKMLFFCVGFVFIFLNKIDPRQIFETLIFVSLVIGILLSIILNFFYSTKILQFVIHGR